MSELDKTGVLQGLPPEAPDRPTKLNASVQVPLAGLKPSPVAPGSILRAAWSVVMSRHTSSEDVLFYTSLREENPVITLFRTVLPLKESMAKWLRAFVEQEKVMLGAGAVPPAQVQQLSEEGVDRTAPTFLVITPQARTFPSRDSVRSALLVFARLEVNIIELHYDSSWFGETEIRALSDHLNIVLRALTAEPETPVGRLPFLTEPERRRVLDEWNATRVPFAETSCIHQLFEQQVRRTPSDVAVVFCDRQWTYAELDAEADRLARRLRAAGVRRGTFVAICIHRSLDLIATLLGVLKAGGAYVPLDPSYPAERLAFMVEDAKPAVIAVSKQTADGFPGLGAQLFFVDEPEGAAATTSPAEFSQSSDAAYVLYTSGSTGKPKGVVITHRNVSNFFTAMDGVIGTDVGVWLAVTSVNFDISVFELFWTLARGFRVILQEEGQWVSATDSKFSLPQQMRRHGVTHLQCTPSLASMLICDPASVNAIRPLRRFMVGGEPLPLDLARRLTEIITGELYNLYGPTETTVWSASQLVPKNPDRILIGRPVANNTLYVLDSERELVPTGAKGELYIGGDGLARGYLHRPDITAERFVEHTFAPGRTERLYRTGDVVRQLGDGRLEFMGRSDNQIKIRGVRIELGEIEIALREHPEIRDAVVILAEDEEQEKRIVAYAIPKSGLKPTVPALQQWLGTKLPKAVVPASILFLTEFPKTPNGKLDRRALPKPDQKNPTASGHETANELERQVAAIWSTALGVNNVGLDERFFDLGGHSLHMVEVHDKLRAEAGYAIPLLDLFQYPTVRALAHHLRQQAKEAKDFRTVSGKLRGRLRLQSMARQGTARQPRPAP